MSELSDGLETQSGDALLEKLTEEFLRRYRAGDRPSIDEYVAKHPDLKEAQARRHQHIVERR